MIVPCVHLTSKMPSTNRTVYYLVLFHIFLSFVLIQSAPKSSLITHVPGFNGTLPSKHYAGYVTVDESHGRNLYYYFVVSEGKPSQDPVVLWLNGGPGCSSFDGFVYGHGPFKFEMSETKRSLPQLQLNPYSWSKVSNIIYLDSPAGTGFSYSKNISDYKTGDFRTASDTHAFLLKWFELYPEFLPNPFFIAGESYAGIFVPTLAHEVVKGIDAGTKPKLNFKGYMIGNGQTDDEFDSKAFLPFAHGKGLISDHMFEEVIRECNGKLYDFPVSQNCSKTLDKVIGEMDELNHYNVLESCYQLGEIERPLRVRKRIFGRSWPFRALVKDGIVPTWPHLSASVNDPCSDDPIAYSWLNNEAVRKAIHTVQKSVVNKWDLCTDIIHEQYNHDAGSMIKYHKDLTSKGFWALIYSGDHDFVVPFTGSEAWTRSIGYKIVDEWRPWLTNGQVAGYTQGYDKNLTFMTIKGAGHGVAEYKPRESLYFYRRFLDGLPV